MPQIIKKALTVPMVTADNEQLTALREQLQFQRTVRHDIVLPAHHMAFEGGVLYTSPEEQTGYIPNENCHNQIGQKLQIPKQYYQRMLKDYPDLLEQNINGWLHRDTETAYMLRTFNYTDKLPVARALLSNRFQTIDNYDVLVAALKAIKDLNVNVKVTKAEITDSRMYLHVVCPDIEVNAPEFLKHYLTTDKGRSKRGDGIITGLSITNSEVGLGTFEICPRAMIIKCDNGMMSKDDAFKRVHLGARMDEGVIEWSEETKTKNYELIISQTKDAIKKFFSKDHLNGMIQKVATAYKIELEKPQDCIKNVCMELKIPEQEADDIFNYFLRDGMHNAGGVFMAVTRGTQHMNADMQYEIEAAAFSMLPKIKSFDKPFSGN